MSIEESIIRKAAPQMVTNRLTALVAGEMTKGCSPEIYPQPCRLEPIYQPLFHGPLSETNSCVLFEEPPPPGDVSRYRIWVSPKQNCDWNRSELFLKQLSRLRHRAGYEISGNRTSIRVGLLVHHEDEPVVLTAFRALFDESELSIEPDSFMLHIAAATNNSVVLYDYYPPPPYSHLLTSYEELRSTSFAGLVQALSQLPETATGFYQCLFQPVSPTNNWHKNVEVLLDLEFEMKLHRAFAASRQFMQQAPSGDLHQMSREVDIKAHNDRPFFCTAVRVGLAGTGDLTEKEQLSVSAFMNLFQHGGRPLNFLTAADYELVVPRTHLPRMIGRGVTLRPGFLVNSRELVGLVHVFAFGILENRRVPLQPLETLPVRNPALLQGTRVGTCEYAGRSQPVCIPAYARLLSTHMMGGPGTGKSTALLNMFLQDIASGKGAVFIDAHGDAVKMARRLIPPALYHKTIYFDPGDPEWTPIWNPLTVSAGGNIYRRADDLIKSMRRVFENWGDRLGHVLRNGLIGLSYLPKTSLLDLYNVARLKSPESEHLRKEILKVAVDEPVKTFWKTDFLQDYRRTDLQAPKHKLSQLVSAGTPSLMLSQTDSRIDFRRMMDEGQIMLVDLSTLGCDLADILGSFVLSVLLFSAISRSDLSEDQRKPFAIFVDEAHRFVSADILETLLMETRKFGIDLVIAHQYLAQFTSSKIDALSIAGSTLLGRLDKRDSEYFAKDLQDLAEPKDLIRLGKYEMIGRIDREVVRFKTTPPPQTPRDADWRRLVEESRRKYCRPVQQIRAELASRSERWCQPPAPLAGDLEEWPFTAEDLAYEEF